MPSNKRSRADSDSLSSGTSSIYRPARKSILRRRSTVHLVTSLPCTSPLPKSLSRRIREKPVIIDTIILHLTRGGYALRDVGSCSLVCKSWCAIARRHFLPSLTLNQCNKSTFFTLTSNPHSTIPNYLRTLSLTTRIPPQCFQSTTRFQGITTLNLMQCTYESMSELGEFMISFRNLEHLIAWSVEWIDSPKFISFSRSHETLPPRLRTLELYLPTSGHCSEFISWLLSFHIPPVSLRTLKFGGQLGKDDIASINSLLSILGHRLKHLHIYNTKRRTIDLSHSHGLESLYLSHIQAKSLSVKGAWITAMGCLVPSTSIKEIGFHLVDDLDDDVGVIDWTTLNAMLARFSGLKRLEFVASAGSKRVVKQEFAQFRTRKILHAY